MKTQLFHKHVGGAVTFRDCENGQEDICTLNLVSAERIWNQQVLKGFIIVGELLFLVEKNVWDY